MRRRFSQQLQNDLVMSIKAASAGGTVNIVRLAEEIRERNNDENVALEDIEHALMMQAQCMEVAMEFGEGVC